MKKLMETIDLMTSDDYKKRFVAEYWQTRIRQEKLRNFCDKIVFWKDGSPQCKIKRSDFGFKWPNN